MAPDARSDTLCAMVFVASAASDTEADRFLVSDTAISPAAVIDCANDSHRLLLLTPEPITEVFSGRRFISEQFHSDIPGHASERIPDVQRLTAGQRF